jgi:CBS domain-containing protein
MKHAGTTALMVLNARTSQPAGIITEADIARAAADGKDPNDVRVYAVMITRPTGETGADPAPPRWPVASRTVPGWSAWPRSAIRY